MDLPDPIFRKLKARAAQRGIKLKELLFEFVQAGLAAQAVARERSPLPEFPELRGAKLSISSNSEINKLLDADDAAHSLRH